ncbi:cullin 3 [Actinidia rufa]|uniref:Cullin 3 n=1 Tax=Actinidia rufa TaxID=165716 RepID=A0A7J0FP15_9ERIC|nr:cullin 3 [Actinidia rufa]
MNNNQNKRKFQTEAFKHRVMVDPKYADKTWKILEHAIHEIYNHNGSGLNAEELYRNAYNMVLHKFGEKLYSGLVSTLTFHIKEISKVIEVAQGEPSFQGEVINRGLMRNIIKMLMDLGPSVYQEDFEKPFLEVSANFYRVESQQFIECCDCGDYLKKAERRLNEEIERVSHYLDAKSAAKITNVVEQEMIANHMLRLVHMENSGMVNMLLDDKYEDLGRMYSLFCRVSNGLSTIRDVMTSHIRETGKQLVTDPEKLKDPVEFVQCLLDEKDKYDRIISLAFSNDKTFQNALNSSFEFFINLNPRSPEFISLFVDDKLRKGLKGVSEEDIEIVLDKVMILFRYLQEKDVFEKYYKQHLEKRLLSGETVSDDAERSLIVKLKTECGVPIYFSIRRHVHRRENQLNSVCHYFLVCIPYFTCLTATRTHTSMCYIWKDNQLSVIVLRYIWKKFKVWVHEL